MDYPEREQPHTGAIDNRLVAYKLRSTFINPSYQNQRLNNKKVNYYPHKKIVRHDWGEDISYSGYTNPADFIGDRRLP